MLKQSRRVSVRVGELEEREERRELGCGHVQGDQLEVREGTTGRMEGIFTLGYPQLDTEEKLYNSTYGLLLAMCRLLPQFLLQTESAARHWYHIH